MDQITVAGTKTHAARLIPCSGRYLRERWLNHPCQHLVRPSPSRRGWLLVEPAQEVHWDHVPLLLVYRRRTRACSYCPSAPITRYTLSISSISVRMVPVFSAMSHSAGSLFQLLEAMTSWAFCAGSRLAISPAR